MMKTVCKRAFASLVMCLFLFEQIIVPAAARVMVAQTYRFDGEEGYFNSLMPDFVETPDLDELPEGPDDFVAPEEPEEPEIISEPVMPEPVQMSPMDIVMSPALVRAAHANHDGVTFDQALTAAPSGTTKITASGNYYLDSDLYLTAAIEIDGAIEVNLCLNGHMIHSFDGISPRQISGNGLLVVKNGATLNIFDCDDGATPHTVRDGRSVTATRTVTGGVIGYSFARGIYIEKNSTVHMYAGTVAGSFATGNGGGIYVGTGATLILEEPVEVRYNRASGLGGGIYLAGSSSVGEINGAEIRDNVSGTGAGGIHVYNNAVLSMDGGIITGNKSAANASTNASTMAGGIYASSGTKVTLKDVRITSNLATYGTGGLYVYKFVASRSVMSAEGDVVISGNMVCDAGAISLVSDGLATDNEEIMADEDFLGKNSNVSLFYDKGNTADPKLSIAGRLGYSASIGITSGVDESKLEKAGGQVCVVKGTDDYTLTSGDYNKLFSDDENRSLTPPINNQIDITTGRVHYICGLTCEHDVKHDTATYKLSTHGFTGGAPGSDSDSYYLDENIELTEPIIIESGRTVNICFNGHEIRNKTGSVFIVEDGATLNLCDCYNERRHTGDLEEYQHTYFHPSTKVPGSITGGLASGNFVLTQAAGGVIVDGGTFNLYGGTIASACKRSGVEVTDGGSFTMWGGAVNNNYKVTSGAGVYVDGTSSFRLLGGDIIGNRCGEDGAGVYAARGFEVQGNVNVRGNVTNVFDNNVFIPANVMLNVTGRVSGTIGIRMERLQGRFTTGGRAAQSVDSFKSDATEGTYVDAVGGELWLTGYNIVQQPTSESRAVITGSPENVIRYQWYEAREKNMTSADVMSLGANEADMFCTYNSTSSIWEYTFGPTDEGEETDESLNVMKLSLKKGDTLRLDAHTPITGTALLEVVTNEETGEEFTEMISYSSTLSEDGGYYVTAPHNGTFVLSAINQSEETRNVPWHDGSYFAAEVSMFTCGRAVPHQTGAGYTGPDGDVVICEIVYEGEQVILYSEPFTAGGHSHLACGERVCHHTPAHTAVDFIPLASNLEGELLAGENVISNYTLTAGNYVVVSDITLPQSLVIDGNVTICLRGNKIVSENGYAVRLTSAATLELGDCSDNNEYGGLRSENGGGLYIPDNATAIIYAADISGSNIIGDSAGVYVSPKAALRVSGKVKVTDNMTAAARSEDATVRNVYLAGGAKIILFEGTSAYTDIGVTAENTLDVFTQGAGGQSALPHFTADEPGETISVSKDELTFMRLEILRQPTVSNPKVTLTSTEGASFQWYLAEPSDITTRETSPFGRYGHYDSASQLWTPAADGRLFTVELDAGEILVLTPGEIWPDGTSVIMSTGGLSAQLEMVATDGMYQWTARENGEQFTIDVAYSGETPTLRAEIYQVTEPQEGKTTDTFSGDPGSYVCIVTYEDGTILRSDMVTFAKAVSPVKNNNSGSSGSDRLAWNPFKDVSEGDWYYYSVKAAYQAGLMEGVKTREFSPDENTTRAMMVTILWRMAGSHRARSKTVFVDVDPSAYYYKAVCWAAENKIVEGVDSTHFEPETFITREEIVTLLYRYATIKDGMMIRKWEALDFSDLPADWAVEAMEWAVESGIIKGKGENVLDPRAFATRAEIAAILSRYKLEVEEE